MKLYITILLIGSCILWSCALPVTKPKREEKEEISPPESTDVDNLHYQHYLKEVVKALDDDKEFREKLENASEADIRNGKIAEDLSYVNHRVRTKLDEIKRREIKRLKDLVKKKFDLENDIDREHMKVNQHLDHTNEHTFEIEDLKKLIKKTAADLNEADQKRQEDFKQYEMQKQFEKEAIKKEMSEEQRKKFEKEQRELIEKHKKHEKVHDPGSKAQLEEVWEKQDHMDKQDFNPRIFFDLHDLDDNGFWDEEEVEALFVKELDKVYQSGLPEDDMRERAEEMERMREHVFQQADTNGDKLISFQEFVEQTKREEYNADPEWHTIDEKPQYTHEEYLEFERKRNEEIQRKIEQGLLSPHPNMPQGYYVHDPNAAYQTAQQYPSLNQQQQQMHYQNPQQQHMQQQQQYQQQQQQYQQHQYQNQQRQYQPQQVHLNPNQVYQHIPAQQYDQRPLQQHSQQQPQLVNPLPPQQPVANDSAAQKQPVSNNVPSQNENLPVGNNNIPQQQQPINNAIPQQNINNVAQKPNYIPQKH